MRLEVAKYLLVDIGSTYTKLTAVDLEKEDIIATSKHFTTVQTDVRIGYNNALNLLYEKIGKIEFEKIYACSSAAGGLKMAAIGLVEELTVEAAKRVCLNAGGKVDLIFSNKLTKSEVEKIKSSGIDIVLLAGGTDGGNSECVLYNAKMLGEAKVEVPIIYAGNKSVQDEIKEIFTEYDLDGHICENVMPRLNELKIDSSRDKIKNIFLDNIIEAKGINKLATEIDGLLHPTPQAVLKAAELLSIGHVNEEGLGDIILVDIGGATTDIYSFSKGLPTNPNTVLRGLEEPFSKRTVEGDLGMRYSASGILSSLTLKQKSMFQDLGIEIEKEIQLRQDNIELVPKTEAEIEIENHLANICCDVAFSRHVGTIHSVYTPLGLMHYQEGKDLSNVKTVIGTGGVVVHSNDARKILKGIITNPEKPIELRPKEANYYLDNDYILSAMGLLSKDHPDVALKIMKKRIKRI